MQNSGEKTNSFRGECRAIPLLSKQKLVKITSPKLKKIKVKKEINANMPSPRVHAKCKRITWKIPRLKGKRKKNKKKMPLHERSSSTRHDVLAELGRRGTWPGHAPGSMIHTRCNLHSPAGGRRGLAARAGSIPAGPITTRSAAERNGRFGWRLAAPRAGRSVTNPAPGGAAS